MDISIVTSLYASRRHLAGFLERLEACLSAVEAHGYCAESIIVSNAPDRSERRTLAAALDSSWWHDHGKLIVVPRETLYASWNRGLRASLGSAVCFWNVDDYRNPGAMQEGIDLIRQGHAVVRFPWLYMEEREPTRSISKRRVGSMTVRNNQRSTPKRTSAWGRSSCSTEGSSGSLGPSTGSFTLRATTTGSFVLCRIPDCIGARNWPVFS